MGESNTFGKESAEVYRPIETPSFDKKFSRGRFSFRPLDEDEGQFLSAGQTSESEKEFVGKILIRLFGILGPEMLSKFKYEVEFDRAIVFVAEQQGNPISTEDAALIEKSCKEAFDLAKKEWLQK